jgi:hypothetical protein
VGVLLLFSYSIGFKDDIMDSDRSQLQEVKYEEQKNDTGYLVDIYFSVVRNCCS